VECRQIGDAEYGDPLGQLRDVRLAEAAGKELPEPGSVIRIVPFDDLFPEHCLPVLRVTLGRDLALFPSQHKLWPEYDVLVIDVRHHGAELKELHACRVALEVIPDSAEPVLVNEPWQAVHDAQRQAVLLKERWLCNTRQDAREHVQHKGIRKRPPDIRTDAADARQLHGEPALHAAALHHDDLWGERRRERLG